MANILILGAGSAIAEHYARLCAQRHDRMLLVARNTSQLQEIQPDLILRGAEQVDILECDFSNLAELPQLVHSSLKLLPDIDVVLIAYGTLPRQEELYGNSQRLNVEVVLNFNSVIILLNELARDFEQRRRGTIAVISSVAGDRGRQSNYIYGSAKGGLSIYLQGLRNRLASANVQVLTIKPGFVDTPMTREFTKGALWVGPEHIARDIDKAIAKRRHILYTPWFWRWIMLIIRMIPEAIFKKLKL